MDLLSSSELEYFSFVTENEVLTGIIPLFFRASWAHMDTYVPKSQVSAHTGSLPELPTRQWSAQPA